MDLQELVLNRSRSVEEEFRRIADIILNQVSLWIKGEEYDIREIEFYYYSESHPDPFAHRQPLQKLLGYWYFHQAGKNGGYKGGTFKGMDLTFTSTEVGDVYGGILIRSIQRDNILIEGPSKVVDHLLSQTHSDSIASLLDPYQGMLLINDTSAPFYLHLKTQSTSLLIVNSPRVGLSLKRPSLEKYKYVMKPYRFITVPTRITKMKHLLVVSLLKQGYSEENIISLTSSTQSVIQRYRDHMKKGEEMELDLGKPYDTTRVEASSKLYGYLVSHFSS